MAIGIFGAVTVCAIYWAIWYAAMNVRRRLPPSKEWGLKWLWRFNGAALLGSGACFIGAALLNRPGSSSNVTITPMDAIDAGHISGGVDSAQAIVVLVVLIVLGTLGVIGVRRTVKAKAAEVQAAEVPAGKLHGWTVEGVNGPTPIEAFSDRFLTPRADSIIDEIKGMRP